MPKKNEDPSFRMDTPRRLLRARDVLNRRATRIIVVLDQVADPHNIAACLRTVEALGLQYVWIIRSIIEKRPTKRSIACIAKGAECWLTIRRFDTAEECVAQLESDGYSVWICADGENALTLTTPTPPSLAENEQIALVVGRETDGVSLPLQKIAQKRVFIPLSGFSASLNLSVATALVLQRLLDWYPTLRKGPNETQRNNIVQAWKQHLGMNLVPFMEQHPNFFSSSSSFSSHGDHLNSTSTGDFAARVSCGSWAPKALLRREEEQRSQWQACQAAGEEKLCSVEEEDTDEKNGRKSKRSRAINT
mmetsp:Transcript_22757/g.29465  ORF Transcript_22757/g.29465 Transcript_22757/m.29465 type:complete len:306 (-) Transcript_22757:348-1265(-)